MSILFLVIIAAIILVFYTEAILVFTPDEKDDKYVLDILEFAFRMHDRSIKKKGIMKRLFDFFSITFLIFDYSILKNRDKITSGHNKVEEV